MINHPKLTPEQRSAVEKRVRELKYSPDCIPDFVARRVCDELKLGIDPDEITDLRQRQYDKD